MQRGLGTKYQFQQSWLCCGPQISDRMKQWYLLIKKSPQSIIKSKTVFKLQHINTKNYRLELKNIFDLIMALIQRRNVVVFFFYQISQILK